MIVLATNIVSEPIKPGPSKTLIAWWRQQNRDQLYLTAITVAKLKSGIEILPSGRRENLLIESVSETLAEFKGGVLPFDELTTGAFALVAMRAKARGNQMGFADASIAAIALKHAFSLATRQTQDMQDMRWSGGYLD